MNAAPEPPGTDRISTAFPKLAENPVLAKCQSAAVPCPMPAARETISHGSEASTPHLASPGTESTFGSPSSLSSFTSGCTGLSNRGESTDAEDAEQEHELEPVSEVDEVDELDEADSLSMAALEIRPAYSKHHDKQKGAYNPYMPHTAPLESCPNMQNESCFESNPTSAGMWHTFSTPCEAHGRLRKGRVFEIMAIGNDALCTSSLSSHEHLDISGDGHEVKSHAIPSMLSYNIKATDTTPFVPSPLCRCVTATSHDAACKQSSKSHTVGGTSKSPTMFPVEETDTTVAFEEKVASDRPDHISTTSLRCGNLTSKSLSDLHSSRCLQDEGRGRGRDRRRSRSKGQTVRFSSAAPIEVRTHSPVDYDRKPCPVNSRLCGKDLEELRELSMPMELLEARCSTLRDVLHHRTIDEDQKCDRVLEESLREKRPDGPSVHKLTLSETNQSPVSKSSLVTHPSRTAQQPDPEADLRNMRERRKNLSHFPSYERPFHHASQNNQLGSMLAARFGLNKPPPPLPGTERSGSSSPKCTPDSSHSSMHDEPHPLVRPNHDAPGYECPVADLYDSGSEYDMVL